LWRWSLACTFDDLALDHVVGRLISHLLAERVCRPDQERRS